MNIAAASSAPHPFPRVGVGALVISADGTRVLLQKRRKPPEAGCWSQPGGRVEFGEKLVDAIARELSEEIGISPAIGAMLCVTDHIVETAHWVAISFVARLTADEETAVRNTAPQECETLQWFPFDNLPPNLTMTTKDSIGRYQSIRTDY